MYIVEKKGLIFKLYFAILLFWKTNLPELDFPCRCSSFPSKFLMQHCGFYLWFGLVWYKSKQNKSILIQLIYILKI